MTIPVLYVHDGSPPGRGLREGAFFSILPTAIPPEERLSHSLKTHASLPMVDVPQRPVGPRQGRLPVLAKHLI